MYLLEWLSENGTEAERWLKWQWRRLRRSGLRLRYAYATGKAGIKVNLPLAREMLTAAAGKGDQQSGRMLDMMDTGKGCFEVKER